MSGRHSIERGDSGDAVLMHARKSAPLRTSRADFASAAGESREKSESARVHGKV